MGDKTDDHDIRAWWQTSIIDMEPGRIEFRGEPIQELIGNMSFAQMIWFMVLGEKPDKQRADLLECALVAAVDHGPQAPSIAAARMAATCGIGINNVMATGVNMLGDIHGGAGEQCVELYYDIHARIKDGAELAKAVADGIDAWCKLHGKIVSGFGHRFHKPVDPRSPRLMQLVRDAASAGTVSGDFVTIGEAVSHELSRRKHGRPIPMNIDGATAVIFAELGFPPELARGIFCLSRSVGILAHGWEQMQQNERNKGPMPPRFLPLYKPEK